MNRNMAWDSTPISAASAVSDAASAAPRSAWPAVLKYISELRSSALSALK